MEPAPSAGKRERVSRDWFEFYFWLVEKVAQDVLTNQSEVKQNQSKTRITFDTQLKTALLHKLTY